MLTHPQYLNFPHLLKYLNWLQISLIYLFHSHHLPRNPIHSLKYPPKLPTPQFLPKFIPLPSLPIIRNPPHQIQPQSPHLLIPKINNPIPR